MSPEDLALARAVLTVAIVAFLPFWIAFGVIVEALRTDAKSHAATFVLIRSHPRQR